MDDRFLDANWRALAATGMARPAGLPAGDRDGGVQREGGTVTGVLLQAPASLVATLAIRCRWLERGTFKYRDAGANPLVAFEASHGDVIA